MNEPELRKEIRDCVYLALISLTDLPIHDLKTAAAATQQALEAKHLLEGTL